MQEMGEVGQYICNKYTFIGEQNRPGIMSTTSSYSVVYMRTIKGKLLKNLSFSNDKPIIHIMGQMVCSEINVAVCLTIMDSFIHTDLGGNLLVHMTTWIVTFHKVAYY